MVYGDIVTQGNGDGTNFVSKFCVSLRGGVLFVMWVRLCVSLMLFFRLCVLLGVIVFCSVFLCVLCYVGACLPLCRVFSAIYREFCKLLNDLVASGFGTYGENEKLLC